MAISFFSESEVPVMGQQASLFPKCGACGLFKTCQSPKMPYTGRGEKKILIVGEWPSSADDNKGKHFQGRSGRFLRESLEGFEIDLDRDCWMTNALICHPEGRLKNAEVNKSIEYCRPNLRKTIDQLKPEIIILLGDAATRSMIPIVWKEKIGAFSRWPGFTIPQQTRNVWICPTYSHTWILNKKDNAHTRYFLKHLEKAVSFKDRPWEIVPDYLSRVKIVRNPTRVIRFLLRFARLGGDVAIDYETNCLKPETPGAFVYSASVSWRAKVTISFLWSEELREAWKTLLTSKLCRLIASNLKFESRWTKKFFGFRIKTWEWDTMLAAHVLDNRKGITSIKFQAFIYLGIESWDDDMKKFLISDDKSPLNNIRRAPVVPLLRYGGLDSLYEVLVKREQKRQLALLHDEE